MGASWRRRTPLGCVTRYLVSIDVAPEKSGDFTHLNAALEHAECEAPSDGTFVIGKVLRCGAPRILVSRSPGSDERAEDRARRAKENDARHTRVTVASTAVAARLHRCHVR